MQIEEIRRLMLDKRYEISLHAERERRYEEIEIDDIKHAIEFGEVLENYSDDLRGQSCLVLGYDKDERPIHIVCGMLSTGVVRIITVYIPSSPKWIGTRTRRKRR